MNYVAFAVMHYAGEVVFDVSGFVEKNQDTLYRDLYDFV
jgi:myosin heavy subunit